MHRLERIKKFVELVGAIIVIAALAVALLMLTTFVVAGVFQVESDRIDAVVSGLTGLAGGFGLGRLASIRQPPSQPGGERR